MSTSTITPLILTVDDLLQEAARNNPVIEHPLPEVLRFALDALLQGDNYQANSGIGIAARLLAAIIVALENNSYSSPSRQSQ